MAEVLKAMYVDRIDAERGRKEAGTRSDAIESEMVKIDNIIETQQKDDIETLEEFALILLISHPEGDDTMRSGISQLINIWNGQQSTKERTNQMYAENEKKKRAMPTT